MMDKLMSFAFIVMAIFFGGPISIFKSHKSKFSDGSGLSTPLITSYAIGIILAITLIILGFVKKRYYLVAIGFLIWIALGCYGVMNLSESF